jgi:exopolysaccharide production protein ExoQ
MPPFVALALSLGFILVLLASERRMNQAVSPAVWIPFLWIFFIGTRFPSQWLDLGTSGSMANADEYLEGSLVDQVVFLTLYVVALAVLVRRRVSLGAIMAANVWVTAFLLYGLLSVAWSDFPWTSFKRFTKVVEHIVMVLVILTEVNSAQAMDALFRRFLSISVVMSVLILKYYPELGRGFDYWTGQAYNTGITTDKNALGHICLLGAVFYTSSLISPAHRNVGRVVKGRTLFDLTMLSAIGWLLNIANAKTALVCALLGVAFVVVLARTRLGLNPMAACFALVSFVISLAVLEWAFNLREVGFDALGRDATLTDRTYVWEDVLGMANNVILGTGFESFWLGPRVELLWAKYWWHPNQAHNGYIETYINLGALGVLLLVVMIIAGLFKSLQPRPGDDVFGPVRFSLIVAIVVFNYTDATFKAVHILYFTFFFMSISLWPAAALSEASARGLSADP